MENLIMRDPMVPADKFPKIYYERAGFDKALKALEKGSGIIVNCSFA